MARTATRRAERPAAPRKGRGVSKGAPAPKPASPRAERQAAKREAILAAALDEFSARGFAATRLDDIAKRADVAKGTIYLYFCDKESLFQELVRTMLSPVVSRVADAPMIHLPPPLLVQRTSPMLLP